MSILERIEYRLPPCPTTTCEDFLEVALWNAKAGLLDTPDAREKQRAGNICNKLVADCEEITKNMLPQLLLLCYLGASSKRILAVDTGGLLLRCAGVLAAAALLVSSNSSILISAIASATDIEQDHLVQFAQALCANSDV